MALCKPGDHFAEFVCLLGLLAGTCDKIGREIYTLMKAEYGELEEPVPSGTVGSSTMPHKRNPQLCHDILSLTGEVLERIDLVAHLDRNAIAALLDPAGHTGCLAQMAHEQAEVARRFAKEIHAHP